MRAAVELRRSLRGKSSARMAPSPDIRARLAMRRVA